MFLSNLFTYFTYLPILPIYLFYLFTYFTYYLFFGRTALELGMTIYMHSVSLVHFLFRLILYKRE